MKRIAKLSESSSWPITILLILFLSSACSSDSGTPTSPSVPLKKTAVISITVNKEPIVIIFSTLLDYGACEPTITVMEGNGVGVDIQTIRIEYCIGSSVYDSLDLSARRLEANGYFRLDLFRQIYSRNYTHLRVKVQGRDDNGHSISKTQDFALTYFVY